MLIGLLLWTGCDGGPAGSISGLRSASAPWAERDGAVLQPLSAEAVIDWTNLQIRVAQGSGGATRLGFVAVEEAARSLVDNVYRDVLERVPIDPDTDLGDVMTDEILAEATRSRLLRWEVVETTYTTSGRVDLVAELPLHTLLKPWVTSIATRGAPPPRITPYVAAQIDARGIGLRPSFVLEVAGPDGREVYSGAMWEEFAVEMPPFVFVRDPAEATKRIRAAAAEGPVLELVADRLVGGQLRLDEDSYRRGVEAADLWGQCSVYVVIGGD